MNAKSKQIFNLPAAQLRPHHDNEKIYGIEDVSELANDIKKSGWIKPLVVTDFYGDYTIVSGHRRHKAAPIAGFHLLPCELEQFEHEWQVLDRLLRENAMREKTGEQKAREFKFWKKVESEAARVRQSELNGKTLLPETFPEAKTGDARDVAAEQAGFGSGRTAEKAEKAIDKIDEFRANGETVKADLIAAALNENNYSGALDLSTIVEEMDDKDVAPIVEDLKSGNKTSRQAKALLKSKIKISEYQNNNLDELIIEKPFVQPYGDGFYYKGIPFNDSRFDDHIIEDETRLPTLTTYGRFFHKETMLEWSFREYARAQTFPDSHKFVGTYQTIKKQIGNAVAPQMGAYVTSRLKGTTIGDLFAGCGGFTRGAHQNGLISRWAVEWEELPALAYKLNFQDTTVYQTNIKSLNPDDFEPVDIIIGGPPCQGFSVAGLRFKDDPRNELYKEFLRFVDALKPMEFVMENVPQIQEIKTQVIDDFESIGYEVETMLVCGEDIGMAQNRKRFFFIGKKRG